MERCWRGCAAGQDEAGLLRQAGVHRIDLRLQPRDLARYDPEHHLRRREILARRLEIGAEIEQVPLDAGQPGDEGRVGMADRADREPDSAVGFVATDVVRKGTRRTYSH